MTVLISVWSNLVEIILLLQSNVAVTRPYLKALLELSHPVIIKPSGGTILKWQISLCFIYPTVSTPLHGEFVSIGTWWFFGLHKLCKTFYVAAMFRLSFVFSFLSAAVSHATQKQMRERCLFIRRQAFTALSSYSSYAVPFLKYHNYFHPCAWVCVFMPKGRELLHAKKDSRVGGNLFKSQQQQFSAFTTAMFHFGCAFLRLNKFYFHATK